MTQIELQTARSLIKTICSAGGRSELLLLLQFGFPELEQRERRRFVLQFNFAELQSGAITSSATDKAIFGLIAQNPPTTQEALPPGTL